MASLVYIFTILGGIVGSILLFDAFTSADSAPQQAAGAAMAAACVVIPYCVARSFEYLSQPTQAVQQAVPEPQPQNQSVHTAQFMEEAQPRQPTKVQQPRGRQPSRYDLIDKSSG